MKEHSLQTQRQEKLFHPRHMVKEPTFSNDRLTRMSLIMRHYVDSGYTPGLITFVHHRGKQHIETIGTTAFNSKTPIRQETIFRLASMTKPITAVAAMILVEECRIRLDDPVDEWLPELKDRKVLRTINSPLDDTVPANRPITVRDLFTFRSGYGELIFTAPTCPLQKAMTEARLPLSEWIFPGTTDEFMKRLGGLPLAFQPGERWLYHMSSEILGVLIARVSGKSLGQFLCERIFEPLGMKDTGFYVPESKLDRLPPCYGTDLSKKQLIILDEARGSQVSQPPDFEAGAGGLVSTIDDLGTFGLMMLNKGVYGRERILSRPSIELMTMDHLTPEQKAASPFFDNFWNTCGWGLGLGVFTSRNDLADMPGRFGWDGAFGTSWWVDPKEELVGILLTQRRPDTLKIPNLTHDFWTSAYQLIDD
ncbi:MAG: serine hydrolase domain-containing protein [Bdellovibrio sp.]